MANIPGRGGAEWIKAREACLRGATVCQMPNCKFPGQPLVHGGSKRNPLRATADHMIRVMDTKNWSEEDRRRVLNDPQYLRPAHAACNSARNQNPLKTAVRNRSTRKWL